MSLTDLEQHVLAHFLIGEAPLVNVVGRFYPRADMDSIFGDKIAMGVRKHGRKAMAAAPAVTHHLIELLIERGALSTIKDKFGGTTHQFQTDTYRALIKELTAADPVLAKAKDGGPDYWEQAFAALTA